MIHIPPRETKQLLQTNRSKVLGQLWSSYNLDLQSNLGVIRTSPRFKINTSTTDDAQLGLPVAFKYFDNRIWAICDTSIFKNTGDISTAFTEDASSGVPTTFTKDESDMELFNSTLCVSITNALYSKAANGTGTGAWTSRDVLSSGNPHILCYFSYLDRLYYSNGINQIISIDTSWATADPGNPYALELGHASEFTITSMKSTSGIIWIGTMDRSNHGGNGKILAWDGLSQDVQHEYKLAAQGCLALLIDTERDVPYAMDSNGVLLKFNGVGFSEIGRLPIKTSLLTGASASTTERFIHPNGLAFTKNGTILANVNNLNSDGTYNENFQAGIYEFDGKGGCVHVGSPSYTTSSTISDYGQTRISRVGALANMNIYSTSGTRNGTLAAGYTYYTNATSTNSAIFYDDSNNTLQKYGYFVTNWILSQNIQDEWQKIVIKYRQLLDSADRIWLKYRIREAAPSSDVTITWTSTTTFTTTTNVSSYWTSGTGGEVEIVQGTGAGKCSHITSIVNNAGTYTVTVDETYTNATGTGKARFQSWNKITTVVDDQLTESTYFGIGKSSERIQIKCCMQFAGDDEIYELSLINTEQTPLE